mmetsp:Transcript_6670/g.14250  ORF Transcript_6670/g.14250 Transcript_6670/m.14250 type:complete len:223 (-) Transcript_6670:123-791(-)
MSTVTRTTPQRRLRLCLGRCPARAWMILVRARKARRRARNTNPSRATTVQAMMTQAKWAAHTIVAAPHMMVRMEEARGATHSIAEVMEEVHLLQATRLQTTLLERLLNHWPSPAKRRRMRKSPTCLGNSSSSCSCFLFQLCSSQLELCTKPRGCKRCPTLEAVRRAEFQSKLAAFAFRACVLVHVLFFLPQALRAKKAAACVLRHRTRPQIFRAAQAHPPLR